MTPLDWDLPAGNPVSVMVYQQRAFHSDANLSSRVLQLMGLPSRAYSDALMLGLQTSLKSLYSYCVGCEADTAATMV